MANLQEDSLSEANIAPSNEENAQEQSRNRSQEDDASGTAKETAIQSLDLNTGATCSFVPPKLELKSISFINDAQATAVSSSFMPLVFTSRPSSLNQTPITTQPLPTFSSLPSPISFNLTLPNQPPSLFLQALSKLSESSLNVTILNRMKDNLSKLDPKFLSHVIDVENAGLHTPDSLTSAPPSYSFVLRQMQTRRRPRLMGTFIPSPSFVQHTPPPNYATAFDLYVENPMPPQPTRVFDFGFTPIPAVCPECGFSGMTVVTSKITLCTHLCAFLLFIFCCWLCSPLPYILRSCKDVHHYCRNCRMFLGMYSPTSPESNYAT